MKRKADTREEKRREEMRSGYKRREEMK